MTALLVGVAVWAWLGRGGTGQRLAAVLGPGAAPAPGARAPGRVGRFLVAGALGLLLVGLLGPALGLLLPAGGLLVRAAVVRVRRERADAQERARAGEACAALVAELRAGRPAADALATAGELAVGGLGIRLRAAAHSLRLGGEPGAALRGGARTAVPELAAGLAVCWQVCAGTGSGLAAAVERLGEALRDGERARAEVAAELAGPRSTAVLLAVLPLAGVGLAALLGARPLQVLLHTPLGVVCLVLGLSLDAVGLWWTRALARRAGG